MSGVLYMGHPAKSGLNFCPSTCHATQLACGGMAAKGVFGAGFCVPASQASTVHVSREPAIFMVKPTAKPAAKAKVAPTQPRGLTAQGVADALSLFACAACTDAASSQFAVAAVFGGVTLPLVLLGLPSLVLSIAGTLTIVVVCAHFAAVAIRVFSLRDETRALDQPDAPHIALASAFVFVPEAVYRTITMRGSPTVDVWSSPKASLFIGGVPSLDHLRALARTAHSQPVVIINCCAWWAGFRDLYASLGLEQSRFPSGRSDVLAIVTALKKACGPSATRDAAGGSEGGGGEANAGGAPVRVLLHCETGAFAAAVATAFVCALDPASDPARAASQVEAAVGGRLPCVPKEGQRMAKLVCALSGGGKKAKGGGGGGVATPAPAAATQPRAGVNDDEDDDDDDEDDAAAEEAARAERWANYQKAVAAHGLPSTGAKPAVGDGWTAVSHTQPARRPAAATSSYAATARMAEAKEQAARAEDERMNEKQRKNRRKAEKAKEASAQREAERLERLQETIRQRTAGRG